MAMARQGKAFLAGRTSSAMDEPNGTTHLLNVFSSLHTFRQDFVSQIFESKNLYNSKVLSREQIAVIEEKNDPELTEFPMFEVRFCHNLFSHLVACQ